MDRQSTPAAQKPEGEITEVLSYMFPEPDTLSPTFEKVSFVTKIGDLGCGVGFSARSTQSRGRTNIIGFYKRTSTLARLRGSRVETCRLIVPQRLKFRTLKALEVKREAEENWGKRKWR